MDGWPQRFSTFEREVAKSAALFFGACLAAGAALGWKIGDVLAHRHRSGRA